MVGIDPDGMDVRATFDVLRIPFSISIDSPEDIVDTVQQWAG